MKKHGVPSMSLTKMLLLLALVLFIIFFFSKMMKREGMYGGGHPTQAGMNMNMLSKMMNKNNM